MLDSIGEPRPEYRYHLLRVAGERFNSNLAALGERELAEAHRQARRTFELESLVLASPEAQGVAIPAVRVDGAVEELIGRYSDRDAFDLDLGLNGLDLETLRAALWRELAFDAVLQRVAAGAEEVSELDERLFYELHRERFAAPERRTVRQILITVNDAYPENCREAALARMERLAERLRETRGGTRGGLVQRFASLARKHSECPTALEDGRIGEAVRGQLFPELDAVLFRLTEGQVAGPVETALGFHLILCERIRPSRTLPFSKARAQIRGLLEERRRRSRQKAWIAELRVRGASGDVCGEEGPAAVEAGA